LERRLCSVKESFLFLCTVAGSRIGANRVKVPTYLYKLVYDATTHKAWVHWQENREGETVGRPISYQELVKRTGVEFLPRGALQH
jgi:endonuclease G